MSGELLLTDEVIQSYCDRLVAKDSCVLNDEVKSILEDFLAKVKQHYEYLIKVKVRQAIRQTTKMFVSDIEELKARHKKEMLMAEGYMEMSCETKIEEAKRETEERIIGEVDKMITQLISQGFLPPEYHSFLKNRWQALKGEK